LGGEEYAYDIQHEIRTFHISQESLVQKK